MVSSASLVTWYQGHMDEVGAWRVYIYMSEWSSAFRIRIVLDGGYKQMHGEVAVPDV